MFRFFRSFTLLEKVRLRAYTHKRTFGGLQDEKTAE